MHSFLSDILTLLYPYRCLSCRVELTHEASFCTACLQFIRPIESPLCVCCGLPFTTTFGPDHLCHRCQTQPPSFRQARAWAFYRTNDLTPQPLSDAIQHFKYHRRLSVGKMLAEIGASYNPFVAYPYDVIIPVPLHIERLRWRGFNQSLLLAQAIGEKEKIEVDPFLLERTRSTAPQTQLSEKERKNNVRGAFTVSNPERLQETCVLLIDDVYTSGATVNECARVLRRSGATDVDVFTLARTVIQ